MLELAWLNAHFQTGLKNLLDRAILKHELWREHVPHRGETKIDEIPFDFSRRAMSVVVWLADGRRRLICKGAADALFPRCGHYEVDGATHALDGIVSVSLAREEERLGREGFRVLAVVYKDVEEKASYARDDEQGLVLRGYVAFFDPPKDSAVDVARESADCMLLDKDLRVLRDGIIEGRRVFVNVLKYIRMGAVPISATPSAWSARASCCRSSR